MFSNRLAFTALAVACVTAAAGGAYLATRQNVPTETPVATAEVATAAAPVEAAAKPVQETEAVVAPLPAKQTAETPAPVSSRPAAPPAPRKREDARPRATAENQPVEAPPRSSQLPTLERSWPSTSAPAPNAPPVAESLPPAPSAAPVEDHAVVEQARTPEPPQKQFEELVVSADSVIGLRVETSISSETAKVEDRVEARVVRDVRSGGSVAIPAGSRALGSVVTVERGGKFKEQGRLGIRFNTLVLADGTRLPITTETITRFGEPRGESSAARIGGGAVVGAILGAIAGGAKGAAIGAAAGGGAGTASVMTRDSSEATLKAGDEVTARILSTVTVTVEK